MKRFNYFIVAVFICVLFTTGCRNNFVQPGYGAQQPYGQVGQVGGIAQPGFGTATQPGFQQPSFQGAQRVGQDLGRRFANGFVNRAIGGVVNLAWRAVGL